MNKNELGVCIKRASGGTFEIGAALEISTEEEIFEFLDFQSYFDRTGLSFPKTTSSILSVFENEKLLRKIDNGYAITNLGAILFAKDLTQFPHLVRKAVRIITYQHNDRLDTVREYEEKGGYARSFDAIFDYVHSQIPTKETYSKSRRQSGMVYPEQVIREMVANALMHQDFDLRGTSPMVEIFANRIEITNPGKPLIDTLRFIDHPPQSRNEQLASFLRRLDLCEERGSGVDRQGNHCYRAGAATSSRVYSHR